MAVQLQKAGTDTALIFVYQLGSAGAPPPIRPRELTAERRYTVTRGFGSQVQSMTCSGAELLRDGLVVEATGSFTCRGGRAQVFCLR